MAVLPWRGQLDSLEPILAEGLHDTDREQRNECEDQDVFDERLALFRKNAEDLKARFCLLDVLDGLAKELLEMRKRLQELMSKMEGNDKLERLLTDVLTNTEKALTLAKHMGGEAGSEVPPTEEPK